MWFWIFMLVMNLMIPATMILFGWLFVHKPPQKINDLYGYRTTRSRKSQAAWDFAHLYFGKLWYRSGMVLLPLTVIVMLAVLGRDEDTVGFVGGILCFVLVLVMILPIYFTEQALKNQFGE